MLIAQYDRRGPVPQDVISAVEVPAPALSEGQVLVEVLAAPINPSDVLTLTGDYGMLPPLPAVGGNEGVGRVAKHGPGVTNPPIGQTVLLPAGCGSWASHVVCAAGALVPLPNEADPKQLSMMTINPPTALLLLREFAALQEGDWVLQNAANSGVGGYLIQLAKMRGLRTINVVRRETAKAAVSEKGGDAVLVDGPDLPQQVKALAGEQGVRLGIDAIGGDATERMASALSNGGTVVNYGALSGMPCQIGAGNLIFRGITLTGFWLAKWFRDAAPEERQAVFGQVAQHIAEGTLHANIHAEYPLRQIKEAVAAAAAGNRTGKILIVP